MSVKKIYKCPHCNGLFEAADYKEDKICCKYCNNEIGTATYVEVEDEKKLIDELFNNEEKIKSTFGFETKLKSMDYFLICLYIVPFFYAGYNFATGAPVRWWQWLLMVIGAALTYVSVTSPKENRKKLSLLKNIVKQHNYSLISISTEIPTLEKKIKEFQNSLDKGSVDKESEYKDLLENVKKFIINITSQGIIKEDYLSYQNKGIQANETKSNNDSEEVLIYITQPSHCPGCNYIYKADELKSDAIVCPDCGTVISIVGASVQKQIQKKIHDFLMEAAANDKNKTITITMFVLSLVSAGISLALAVWLGPLEYFCSWAVISFIFTTMLVVWGLTFYYGAAYTLRNAAKKGISDMLELEYLVKTYALHLEDEYKNLKADIIKIINNKG